MVEYLRSGPETLIFLNRFVERRARELRLAPSRWNVANNANNIA